MNFFEEQDKAKASTAKLVFLFSCAVVATILSVYLVLEVLIANSYRNNFNEYRFWNPELFTWCAAITCAIVIGGTIKKLSDLQEGGKAVAAIMKATPIDQQTTEPSEKMLLNVVEEMTIASGVMMPQVYIMRNEPGINAFAAGLTPSDSIIAITDGGLARLSRDELQGVVAHEFSHILNADARINLQLIGWLYGIKVIALIGERILNSRSRGKGAGQAKLFAMGLIIVGSLGHFFGKVIQKAICRQREYLADACAVQFTRNTFGLVGALKKIAGQDKGSKVLSPGAGEISHMFFAENISEYLTNLLSTHPPIVDRVRRLDPSEVDYIKSASTETEALDGLMAFSAGTISPQGIEEAGKVLANLPEGLAHDASLPWKAPAIIIALLMDSRPQIAARQKEFLDKCKTPGLVDIAKEYAPLVKDLDKTNKLALVNLSGPALKKLDQNTILELTLTMDGLAKADEEVGIFEFAIKTIVEKHLRLKKVEPAKDISRSVSVLLSSLCSCGSYDKASSQEALEKIRPDLAPLRAKIKLLPTIEISRKEIAASIAQIDSLSFKSKAAVITAMEMVARHDAKITPDEADLVRAVSMIIGVPVPPLTS